MSHAMQVEIDLIAEYRNARSLVADAIKRNDHNALTVAKRIHNEVLDRMRRELAV